MPSNLLLMLKYHYDVKITTNMTLAKMRLNQNSCSNTALFTHSVVTNVLHVSHGHGVLLRTRYICAQYVYMCIRDS